LKSVEVIIIFCSFLCGWQKSLSSDHPFDRLEEVATIRCPFERDELVLEPIREEAVAAPQRDDRFSGEEVEAEEIDVDRSSDRRFG
jgi:hypothetical protein